MEWRGSELGVVETIFEEDSEEELQSCSVSSGSNNPRLSPALSASSPNSSSPDDLQSSVEAWSLATKRKPDVKLHVQGVCFTLHKDILITKSAYLKRHIKEAISDLTLSPPLKLTPEAFKLVAEFCYGCDVILSPTTLASLRTAVELLEIFPTSRHDRDGEDLRYKAESYFSLTISPDIDLSAVVFRSCIPLLPEAEDLAFFPSRCLEAVCSSDNADGGSRCCDDCLKDLFPDDFMVIVDSMQRRFTRSHDLLYQIVDSYLKAYGGKMSEEQKMKICNSIDCGMVSTRILTHVVQNPRMPLRFVVQAMLMDQLSTHRSIFSAIASLSSVQSDQLQCQQQLQQEQPLLINDRREEDELPDEGRLGLESESNEQTTLGALLQRDAAIRQVAQLKEAIDSTSSRIHTLESELSSMKLKLLDSDQFLASSKIVGDCSDGRSVSWRFSNNDASHYKKVERGQRGSVSASNLQFRMSKQSNQGQVPTTTLNTKKSSSSSSFGQRLMQGLKNAFRGGGTKRDQSKAVVEALPCSDEERGIADGIMEGDHDRIVNEAVAAAATEGSRCHGMSQYLS